MPKSVSEPMALLNYECSFCGRLFRLKWLLKDHMRRKHEAKKPCKCNFCPKTFIKNSALKKHLETHSDETRYECRHCTRACRTYTGRIIHEDQHGYNTYVCSTCSEVFKSYVKLNKHKKIHKHNSMNKMIEAGNYECSYCNYKFSSLEFKVNHEMKAHSGGTKIRLRAEPNKSRRQFRNFICPVCSESLTGNKAFKKHAEKFHPGQSIFYQLCAICTKKISIYYYPEHLMAHNGIRPYSCDVCDAKFVRRGELLHHATSHSNIMLVECQECHMKLKTKKHLSTHKKIWHAGKNFFSCDICRKVFKNSKLLNSHQNRTHYRRENNEKCNFCSKLIAKFNFESHLKKCHSDVAKLCSICGSYFKNKFLYNNHLQQTCNSSVKSSPGIVSCITCPFTATNMIDIKNHYLNMHKCNNFVCTECPYICKNKEMFKRHLIEHKDFSIDLSIIECCFCGFLMANETALQSHMKSHEYSKWLISWNNQIEHSHRLSESSLDKPQQSLFPKPKPILRCFKLERNLLMINVTKEIAWIDS